MQTTSSFVLRLFFRAGLLCCIVLAGLWPISALANGRPPNSTGVFVNPANPQQIFVGTTFGPAISQDCGATFSWVCEGAVVPGGFAQADYNFFWGADGAMLIQGSSASSYGGVARSVDGGCNWTQPQEFNNLITANLSGDPQNANIAYVPANDATSGIGYVYRSTDVGATWTQMSLNQANVYWYSVQASKYTPQVIVAAGFDNNFVGPYIATSRDDGNTWSTVLTAAGDSNQLDVPELTLHPGDPNVMFIAVGVASSGDSTSLLLRSADGGVTASTVATIKTQYRDMHIADDGNSMWFSTDSSVSYSSDGGLTFTVLPAPADNACVSWYNGTMYACGNDSGDGFSVAASRDNGATLQSGFALESLTQAQCPSSSGSSTICTGSNQGQWGYYSNLIGAGGSNSSAAQEPNFVPLNTYCSAACVNDGNCTAAAGSTGSTGSSGGSASQSSSGGGSKGGCSCSGVSGREGLTWMACIGAAWAMAVRHRREKS